MDNQAKVAKYKVTAREALRMKLISARQSKIAALEADITSLNECKAGIEHEITVENYEIEKLDANHPNYAKNKESKEAEVTYLKNLIANHDKAAEEVNKEITKEKEGIANIENGTTKVSLEQLNALVADMIKQNALNQAVLA